MNTVDTLAALASLAHDTKQPVPSPCISVCRVDEQSGLRYIYKPGNRKREPSRPLVYEPEVVDPRPWVLLSNGEVERRDFEAIVGRLPAEAAP